MDRHILERIWQLAKASFWVIVSTAVIYVNDLISGNNYHEINVILIYVGLAGILVGIVRGVIAMLPQEAEPEEKKDQGE